MATNPLLALQTRVPNVGAAVNQFANDMAQAQDRERRQEREDALFEQQKAILQDKTKARSAQEAAQLAVRLQAYAKAGDMDSARRLLAQHKQNIGQRIAAGEPVNTVQTDEMLAQIDNDPDAFLRNLDTEVQLAERFGLVQPGAGGEAFTLTPGARRFDAQGNLIAEAPVTEKPDYRSVKGVGLVRINPDGSNSVVIREPAGGPAKPGASDVAGLRKEFSGLSKDFRQVRDAFAKVQVASENPSPAGDIALIFNYMKMLDPGSVVREGEFATAQNAAGVPDRVVNVYNRLLSGERLNPAQRQDFAGQARNVYTAQETSHRQLEEQFTGIAERFGMDPRDVVVDFNPRGGSRDGGVITYSGGGGGSGSAAPPRGSTTPDFNPNARQGPSGRPYDEATPPRRDTVVDWSSL